MLIDSLVVKHSGKYLCEKKQKTKQKHTEQRMYTSIPLSCPAIDQERGGEAARSGECETIRVKVQSVSGERHKGLKGASQPPAQ